MTFCVKENYFNSFCVKENYFNWKVIVLMCTTNK